jgi:hypothetical protein
MLDNNLLTDSLMLIADSLILSNDGVAAGAGRGGVVLALGGETDCSCCKKKKKQNFKLTCTALHINIYAF